MDKKDLENLSVSELKKLKESINDEIEKISKLENNIIAQKPNKKGLSSEADLEKYSSEIKTQVFENWKRPRSIEI